MITPHKWGWGAGAAAVAFWGWSQGAAIVVPPSPVSGGGGGVYSAPSRTERRHDRNRILRIQREDEEIIVMAIQFIEMIGEDD